MSALLADLTRPELDELLHVCETADQAAHQRLRTCPLDASIVAGTAGVASDCLALWHDALDESARRWTEELARLDA
jgi:hypothetical protein